MALLAWYQTQKRDLPWRRTRDPYAIWLSEIMLQQTRVETVIPYYERFLTRFPGVERLAEAPLEQVLAEWSGLGYYRRARMLHAAAKAVVEHHDAAFPRTAACLRTLPGVGRYTAGAISSIAWGEREPLVDGNVARVFARLFALDDDPTRGTGHARIWSIASAIVPAENPGDFNQSLMELGATVCTPRAPRCDVCPLAASCRARAAGRQEELPNIATKRAPEVRRVVALLAHSPDGVLLARRAEGGLFAGLWEPPSIEWSASDVFGSSLWSDEQAASLRKRFIELVAVAPRTLRFAGSFVHVLTHRRLEVTVIEGALSSKSSRAATLRGTSPYDALRVVNEADLDSLPTSTLMRRMLATKTAGDGKTR